MEEGGGGEGIEGERGDLLTLREDDEEEEGEGKEGWHRGQEEGYGECRLRRA